MIERARLRCPVYVLVMTRDAAVARWAAEPIAIGPYDSTYRCIVVGPDAIPRIRSVTQAREMPELAILSAIHHGNEPGGIDIVGAAIEATEALDEDQRRFYDSVVWGALNAAARELLQKRKNMPANAKKKKDPYDNPITRWRLEFKQEGIVQGRAESVLAVLRARGFRVPKVMREQILACRDLPTLDRWLARAVVVDRAAEVLGAD